MIRFACPRCKSVLEAPDKRAGSKIACPKCQQRLQIPVPVKLATSNKTVLGKPLEYVAVLEAVDDEDNSRKRHKSSFECPRCGSREKPESKEVTAMAGWILFAVLLVFAFPLCWLGFFIRETWAFCPACGYGYRTGPARFNGGCVILVGLFVGFLALVFLSLYLGGYLLYGG